MRKWTEDLKRLAQFTMEELVAQGEAIRAAAPLGGKLDEAAKALRKAHLRWAEHHEQHDEVCDFGCHAAKQGAEMGFDEALDALLASAPVVVAPKPSIAPVEPSKDAADNTTLRARWTALKVPLRPFVARHDITRTPFQKWVAGERDMHGETLAKYEAAIAVEESAK